MQGKIAIAFLAVLALAAASSSSKNNYGWEQGKEYTYKTKVRLMTGIPELKNQYSGIQARLQLKVQVKDDTTLAIKPSHVEIGEVHGQVWEGWTSDDVDFKPLKDAQNTRDLEQPFLVNIKKGAVKSLVVDGSLPQEAVNFQKALVNALQLDLQERNSIESSRARQTLQQVINQAPAKGDQHTIFTTMEATVNGECETLYDISQLPKYMVAEDPRMVPAPEACDGGNFFEVIQTTNFSNCEKRPVYNFVAPLGMQCPPGVARCGDYWNRAAETVYVLCGEDRANYAIQRVMSKEVVVVDPFGYSTESLQGGAQLNMTLQSVKNIQSAIHGPSNAVKVKDLTYDFPQQSKDRRQRHHGQQDSSEESDENSQQRSPRLRGVQRMSAKMSRTQWRSRSQEDSRENRSGHGGSSSRHHSSHESRFRTTRSTRSSYENKGRQHQHSSSSERRPSWAKSHSSSFAKDNLPPAYWSVNASSHLPKPSLTKAYYLPLLTFGVNGPSVINQKDAERKVAESIREVAEALVDVPQHLAKKEIPSQIEKISRFLALLDLEQLKELYRELAADAENDQQPKSTSDKKKSAQRSIFLDSVAMCGSNPCVMLIKAKIESKALQGEEAAQAVSTIPKYAQTPTKELIDEMFDLVKKTETSSKGISQLESTTLLAFSSLVHHAFIRPQAQHTKYATSLFGAFGSPKTKEISKKYVPYIANRLRSADSNYEQSVYITALGLIGHESILPALRPYVQGEADSSNDVRAKAIFALRHLALEDSYYRNHKPQVSMEVMKTYATIVSSPAEQYEVRIVALGNLILANPPFVYFQRLALRTWYEPDNQVSSAIYSTLSSLSSAQDPFHYHMAKKASQALQLAKPVQQGLPYSFNYMSGDEVKNWNLAYFNHIVSIASRSGLLPNKAYARSYLQYGDFSFNPYEVSVNASAAGQLIASALENLGANDDDDSSSYPALNKIRRALNIKKRTQGPAEGSAYVKILGEVTRMLPIDETLLKTFKRAAVEAQRMLGQEQHFSLQKAFKAAEVIVSVPTIAGIPLVATFRYPIVASVQGKAKFDAPGMSSGQLPSSLKAKAQIKAVLIAQKIATMSFMEPLSQTIFSAGVEKQTFVQAPLQAEALIDLKAMRAELAMKPHQDSQNQQEVELIQFHVRPYTAIRRQISPKPTSQTQSAEVKNIHITNKAEKIDEKVGQKALGLNFRVQQRMECCRGDFAAWYRKARHFSPAAALQFFDESNTIAARETRITFDAAQSNTDQVTASIHIGHASKSADEEKVDVTFKPAQRSLQEDEQSSQQDVEQGKEKMKKALAQAKAGYAVTVAAELELSQAQGGPQQARRYAAAVTVAKGTFGLNEKVSLHLERPQISGYDSQPWELCAEARSKFPALPAYSYSDMIQSKVEAQAKAQISYGQQCDKQKPQIEIQIDMERSEGQKQNVEQSVEARQCVEDEKQGQQLSPACRNATLQAAVLNEYDIKINYQQVPSSLKNASYQLEDLATAALYPYMSQDRLNVNNKDNQIKIHVKVHQSNDEEDYMNVRVEKPSANIEFTAVPLSCPLASSLFPVNARQSVAARLQDQILGGNDQTECLIDGQQVQTFDNSSYEMEFSQDNYHLLTKDCSGSYKFAVLAKDDPTKREQKKVKIILGNTEIKIEPTEGSKPPKVEVDGEKQEVDINKWIEIEDRETGETEARLAATKDGYVQVEAPRQRIQVTTDGERIIIESSFAHRGDLCGLCGSFNGEQSADLQTPEQCVESQDDADDFVQSYEIDESGNKQDKKRRNGSQEQQSSQEQSRKQRKQSSRRSSAVRGCANEKDKTMSDLMSALQGHSGRRGHGQSARSSHGHGSSSHDCTTRRHKVVARQGEKCFSLRPVEECKPGCRPTNMIPQQIAFHCVPEGSLAEHLESKAESSQLPEMSGKSADLTRSVFTPKSCTSSMQ